MKFHYDEGTDSLFIKLREADYGTSEEICDGFVIDFDTSGRPMSFDIYSKASEFVDIEQMRRSLRPVEKKLPEPRVSYIADAPLDKKKP